MSRETFHAEGGTAELSWTEIVVPRQWGTAGGAEQTGAPCLVPHPGTHDAVVQEQRRIAALVFPPCARAVWHPKPDTQPTIHLLALHPQELCTGRNAAVHFTKVDAHAHGNLSVAPTLQGGHQTFCVAKTIL